MSAEFIIRTMRRADLDIALEWAAGEGWNPGLHDAEAFYRADQTGYFVGLLSGVPVACISAVAYSDAFGFLGLYIVKPEYRGRGFGIKIWERALEHLGGRNAGLDGVVARQADYEKYGFKCAYRNLRFSGSPAISHRPSGNIVDLKNVKTSKIVEYDSHMVPAERDDFISGWVNQQESRAAGYISEGRLAGYGVVRTCITGFKVGPLFADSKEIAQELLSELARHAGKNKVFIDVPGQNQQALDLAEQSGMKKVFETVRMYNRAIPNLPMSRIYGVTTLELG